VIVYVSAADSDAGSLTVARQLPLASGSDASMADDPPTLWLPLGQFTSIVRYVSPDHVTETSMAPVPVKPKLLERCCGGSMTPCDCIADGCAAATVVVVVGATVVVVVATGAAAPGPPPTTAAVGAVSPRTGWSDDVTDVGGVTTVDVVVDECGAGGAAAESCARASAST
jgi:hypothetical protein